METIATAIQVTGLTLFIMSYFAVISTAYIAVQKVYRLEKRVSDLEKSVSAARAGYPASDDAIDNDIA